METLENLNLIFSYLLKNLNLGNITTFAWKFNVCFIVPMHDINEDSVNNYGKHGVKDWSFCRNSLVTDWWLEAVSCWLWLILFICIYLVSQLTFFPGAKLNLSLGHCQATCNRCLLVWTCCACVCVSTLPFFFFLI